jgi:hypothetical protein
MSRLDKIPVTCMPIPERAEVMIIEVPPFPRLD